MSKTVRTLTALEYINESEDTANAVREIVHAQKTYRISVSRKFENPKTEPTLNHYFRETTAEANPLVPAAFPAALVYACMPTLTRLTQSSNQPGGRRDKKMEKKKGRMSIVSCLVVQRVSF